jgi:hypothetical protein
MYNNKRCQNFYIFKYIVPYVHLLKIKSIDHNYYMFWLSKKTHLDYMIFKNAVEDKKDIFCMGKLFPYFVKSDFYK